MNLSELHNRGVAMGRDVWVIDLGQPLYNGIPSSPSHPGYRHTLMRRHGDVVREDGTSGANDLIVLGTHTGTHIDALSHVSHDGLLHGGLSAFDAQSGGIFSDLGAHQIPPIFAPGKLFDFPSLWGVERLDPGTPITAADLDAAESRADLNVAPGDAVLIRTGWDGLWNDPERFLSHDLGVPGVDESGARWLSERAPRIVGSDTTAFEHIPAKVGHARLPAHRVLIVESGIPIVEMLNLEALAPFAGNDFTVVLIPLPLRGATGSPVRPVAILSRDNMDVSI